MSAASTELFGFSSKCLIAQVLKVTKRKLRRRQSGEVWCGGAGSTTEAPDIRVDMLMAWRICVDDFTSFRLFPQSPSCHESSMVPRRGREQLSGSIHPLHLSSYKRWKEKGGRRATCQTVTRRERHRWSVTRLLTPHMVAIHSSFLLLSRKLALF